MERLSPSPKFQPIKFGHSRETKFITPDRWIRLQSEPLQFAALAPGLRRLRNSQHIANKDRADSIFMHQGEIILLHSFIKKTKKTPNEDRALALRRKNAYLKNA
jgi:phage-related protein